MQQLDRESLVIDNQRLVYHMYDKLSKNQITINHKEDIISEGMVGSKGLQGQAGNEQHKSQQKGGEFLQENCLLHINKSNETTYLHIIPYFFP